ncbi:putative oxidoreductase [Crenobacter luteus]|uniref:DoxX family protein n=1 Tax=Crenobacter luteus TaxID=1452487 RepID=UPI001050B442|nr:DoxX family protein [Crenobacter luteus]TCP15518.1 putative oxidoreductase [Crenobacter luteus]
MHPVARLVAFARPFVAFADTWLRPLALVWARVVVGLVFFRSGLTKLDDWQTTLLLFTEEYHVPLLPPAVAAALGTAGEVLLPPLLIAGLAGRFAAAGLFVVNATAVISYPALTETTREFHLYWAMLLALVASVGPGTLSLDAWLCRRARAA